MPQSARYGQLSAQRQQFSAYNRFSSGTRVSGGGISMADRAASIARKTAEDELQIKTKQYNEGLIGNEEMRVFLQELTKNGQLDATEKADIESKIRDFDSRIYLSRLESVYKNSPQNSVQRAQAAQTIANYYQDRASSMAPGTPVQYETLEKVGQWKQVVASEQNSIERNNRSLLRAQLFRNAANTTPNSIDEALAQADAYSQLAEQARADGDETQAIQFETQAQNEYNKIPIIQERMAREAETEERQMKTAQKSSILNYVNEAQTLYERGRISGNEMLARLEEADKAAVEVGDSSLQFRLTNIAQRVYRDIERGVSYSDDGTFGNVSRGGGGSGELVYDPTTGTLAIGGGASNTVTGKTGNTKATGNLPAGPAKTKQAMSLSELDEDYKNNVKKVHQWFLEGSTPDGKSFGAKEYTSTLSVLSQARSQDLSNIVANLQGVSPTAKVMFNGKKTQVKDILSKFSQELDAVSVESRQLQTGDIVPVMTYSDSGTIKGKPVIELKPRSQVKDLDANYIQDSQGVFHSVKQDSITFKNAKEYQDYLKKNPQAAMDNGFDTLSAKGNKYINVTDEAGNIIRYEYNPQYGYIPKIVGNPEDPKDNLAQNLKKLQDVLIKEAEEARVSGKPINSRAPLTPAGLQSFIESGEGDKILAPSLNLQVKPPTFQEKVGDSLELIKEDVGKVKDFATEKVVKPIQEGTFDDQIADTLKTTTSNVVKAASNIPNVIQKSSEQLLKPITQSVKPGPIPTVKVTPQAVKAVQQVQQKPVMKSLEPPKISQQSAQMKQPAKQPNILEEAKKKIISLGQRLLPSIFK